MKKNLRAPAVFLLIHIALFYLLPLLIKDTGSAMTVLLVLLPLGCLISAVLCGSLYGFHPAYFLLVALVFAPTVWIYFNESAWVYIPVYGGLALIGNAIGAGIRRYRNSKS